MLKLVCVVVALILFLLSMTGLSVPVQAAPLTTGEEIFNAHCIGCHSHGGNIVRRGKTLKKRALQRNHMDSLEAIATIVANGKNNMSAYRDRLSEQQIQDVSVYVLQQAEQGWH